MLAINQPGFWKWVILACVAAAVAFLLNSWFCRMWNRRFVYTVWHRISFVAVSLMAFIAVLVWPASANLEAAVRHRVETWKEHLSNPNEVVLEQKWRNSMKSSGLSDIPEKASWWDVLPLRTRDYMNVILRATWKMKYETSLNLVKSYPNWSCEMERTLYQLSQSENIQRPELPLENAKRGRQPATFLDPVDQVELDKCEIAFWLGKPANKPGNNDSAAAFFAHERDQIELWLSYDWSRTTEIEYFTLCEAIRDFRSMNPFLGKRVHPYFGGSGEFQGVFYDDDGVVGVGLDLAMRNVEGYGSHHADPWNNSITDFEFWRHLSRLMTEQDDTPISHRQTLSNLRKNAIIATIEGKLVPAQSRMLIAWFRKTAAVTFALSASLVILVSGFLSYLQIRTGQYR